MRDIALHLLDIAHNSVSAKATKIEITVIEDTVADRLHISVEDNGTGMDPETASQVVDPFVTSRKTRSVGLGIPLLKAASEACAGFLTLTSQLGKGTRIDVEFQHSHIDRMPLGDIAEVILLLVVGCPEVNWHFTYQFDQNTFSFDDAEIKEELGGVSLTEPAILAYLRSYLKQGVADTQTPVKEF